MPLPRIIAIDGPAASGKSTIGKELADYLGYLFFDTGVMYRAVTWAALDQGLDIQDETSVSLLANNIVIDVRPPTQNDGRVCDILVNEIDVTWNIRQAEVEANVSIVSAYSGVRTAMTKSQRQIGQRGGVVMVGRDIGTVVLPEADLKIYLDASVEERACRRFKEIEQRGNSIEFDEILASMRNRDEIDSTRAIAPLRPADDAVILVTSNLSTKQVLEKVIQWVQEKNRQK